MYKRQGLDYVELGKTTGKMAAKVLKGEAKASDIPYEMIEDSSLYLNTKVAENLNLEVPQAAVDRAVETFTEISAE